MAAPDLHPRRIVHVTEAPLGGVVTYLDELLSLQIKMMPDTAIDLITPSVNRPALEHLWAPNFTIIDYPMSRGSVAGYYPELNPLLPLAHYDRISGCPAAKSIPVRVVAVAG